jgi:hypothetical protein
MVEQRQRRVPAPVTAALVILLLTSVVPVATTVTGGASIVAGLIVCGLVLALAYGLWRGSGRARFWTTVFSTGTVVYGVVALAEMDPVWLAQMVGASVIVGLLLVPASSRRWFEPGR